MRVLVLIAAFLLPAVSFGAISKQCYTLSSVKNFSANDRKLPLLCIHKNGNRAKTSVISVEKRVGKIGFGSSEYVAKVKSHPYCRHCNKNSYKLMSVAYDSPYLIFNGHKSSYGEHGYLILRGEGYYYSSTNRM